MLIIIFGCVAVALIVYAFVHGYRSTDSSGGKGKRTRCSVCGTASVVWNGQYCSPECESRLAKSMDDWHDRFEDMDKD